MEATSTLIDATTTVLVYNANGIYYGMGIIIFLLGTITILKLFKN